MTCFYFVSSYWYYFSFVLLSPYSSGGDVANSLPVLFDALYYVGPAIPEINFGWLACRARSSPTWQLGGQTDQVDMADTMLALWWRPRLHVRWRLLKIPINHRNHLTHSSAINSPPNTYKKKYCDKLEEEEVEKKFHVSFFYSLSLNIHIYAVLLL